MSYCFSYLLKGSEGEDKAEVKVESAAGDEATPAEEVEPAVEEEEESSESEDEGEEVEQKEEDVEVPAVAATEDNKAVLDLSLAEFDSSQHNVIGDPETLKINAIIDWKQVGPGTPLKGKENDREKCRDWLVAHSDEVEMQHPHSLEEKLGK
ncbi:hypothetical protein B0T21DRAFT_417069 [Apiosordaria backusii]|uniref:Uncharacterized protein n=1 Tax=Apiosordaria backusii TaxID=314023 RepID=A0AA39ZPX1_9PEZI|nr:hypothetical protein B0T21DRAFT_417069 [Apiosordaria backusii]